MRRWFRPAFDALEKLIPPDGAIGDPNVLEDPLSDTLVDIDTFQMDAAVFESSAVDSTKSTEIAGMADADSDNLIKILNEERTSLLKSVDRSIQTAQESVERFRTLPAGFVTSQNQYTTSLQTSQNPTTRAWYTSVIGWTQQAIRVCDGAIISLGTQIDSLRTLRENIDLSFNRMIHGIQQGEGEEAYYRTDPDSMHE
ncbi:MAG TPA: hypothetical protein VF590_05505 [Isosphaeraceae bacterium]|jgi:hypothetical protein